MCPSWAGGSTVSPRKSRWSRLVSGVGPWPARRRAAAAGRRVARGGRRSRRRAPGAGQGAVCAVMSALPVRCGRSRRRCRDRPVEPGDADLGVGHAVEDVPLRRRPPRSRWGRRRWARCRRAPPRSRGPAAAPRCGRAPATGRPGRAASRRPRSGRAGLSGRSRPGCSPVTPWWRSSQPSSTRIGGGPAPIFELLERVLGQGDAAGGRAAGPAR